MTVAVVTESWGVIKSIAAGLLGEYAKHKLGM
jgi:hypothetical protein